MPVSALATRQINKKAFEAGKIQRSSAAAALINNATATASFV